MPHLETTVAFFGLSLLLGFTPGPDNIFVVMQTAANGRKAGFLVVLGLCTGLIAHTAAVALGLAAVFATSASAFVTLKYLGAAYLAYLAWQAFRAPVGEQERGVAEHVPLLQLYFRGLLMNLTNPKIVLFFLAFLPQFVDPALGSLALQVSWFGFIFILATLLSFGSIVYMGALFGKMLSSFASAKKLLNRAAAFTFLGLALRLAAAERRTRNVYRSSISSRLIGRPMLTFDF
jgi:threonine/homoserine/homoserine lactone efflux protein